MSSYPTSRKFYGWLALGIASLLMLPFLGLTEFNTKGEPREAVVSLSMLAQDDWVLPSNNGGDIPYKPPLMHWCIAGCAKVLSHGEVTEYVSRLPSALSLVLLVWVTYLFFSRPASVDDGRAVRRGFLTALLTLTAFEVYRAGMACRVDMMLTLFIVSAVYSLALWWETPRWGWRRLGWGVLALLMMSGGTLTKGPVGIVLPCLVAGVYMLVTARRLGRRWWQTLLWIQTLAVMAVAATGLPLLWYAAAYSRGGEEFLTLVMEENFGRMTGTMAYESHLNPWPYNIATLLAGFLPWTLLALMALCAVKYKGIGHRLGNAWRRLRGPETHFSDTGLLALTGAAVIFIFYCIPASKRSVYLLPMYPLCAYGLALLFEWLAARRARLVDGFARGLRILAWALPCIWIALVVAGVFGAFDHMSARTGRMLQMLAEPSLRAWLWLPADPAAAWTWGWWGRHTLSGVRRSGPVWGAVGMVCAIYLTLAGCYLPGVLNAKSVKAYSQEIAGYRSADGLQAAGHIYEYIPRAEEALGNPMHYFEIDFYTGDGVQNFVRALKADTPATGYVLIEPVEVESARARFGSRGVTITGPVVAPPSGLPRHTPALYRFDKDKR